MIYDKYRRYDIHRGIDCKIDIFYRKVFQLRFCMTKYYLCYTLTYIQIKEPMDVHCTDRVAKRKLQCSRYCYFQNVKGKFLHM